MSDKPTYEKLEQQVLEHKKYAEGMKALMENSSDCILICDKDAKPVFFNKTYSNIIKEVLGIEMIPGLNPHTLLPDPEVREWWDSLHARVLSGETFKIEYEHELKERGVLCFEVSYTPILKSGEVHGFTEITRETTDHRQAKEMLQQRESTLSAIIENQPGLVWIKDKESRFLAVNHSFALSCGKKGAEELVGLTDLDIWPQELAKKYRSDDQMVRKKASSYTVEELVSDRGELCWFETFKTPVLSSKGVVIGTTGYARDITERKLAENALQQAHNKLEQRVQERTTELEQKTVSLEEANIALKVLMKQQEEVKKELEKNILFNVNKLVKPSLEKLKQNTSDNNQKVYLEVIESNLEQIVAPFSPGLTGNFSKLTPSEIHIADLIRQGKTTKEIAGLLSLSPTTIAGHRQNIRKKLDLTNKKLHLQTTLKSDS